MPNLLCSVPLVLCIRDKSQKPQFPTRGRPICVISALSSSCSRCFAFETAPSGTGLFLYFEVHIVFLKGSETSLAQTSVVFSSRLSLAHLLRYGSLVD